MANTTMTARHATSWTDFNESKRDEIPSQKAVFIEPFEILTNVSLEMKAGGDLAITIATCP
jgi:hypothetical protein